LIDGQIPSWLLDQIDLVVISPGVRPATFRRVTLTARRRSYRRSRIGLQIYKRQNRRDYRKQRQNDDDDFNRRAFEKRRNRNAVGGNIGTPLIDLAESSTDETWTVCELSSFQLETIKDFCPNVAIALNVTPNHLDRYDFFSDYAAAKHRLL
jgi:UDP-N-acetylmuramoylalanine--D-glutamate ligase